MSMREVVDAVAGRAVDALGRRRAPSARTSRGGTGPTTCRRSRRGDGPGRAGADAPAPARRLAAGRRHRRACRSRAASPSGCGRRSTTAPRCSRLKRTMRDLDLVTVCEEAGCPNLSECWADGTATFMVNGERCTRACGFCLVDTRQPAGAVDADEPERVAEAVDADGPRRTPCSPMVARDDLRRRRRWRTSPRCVEAIRAPRAGHAVEVLISDCKGDAGLARTCCSTPGPTCSTTTSRPSPGCSGRCARRPATPAACRCWPGPRRPGSTTKSGLIVGHGRDRRRGRRLRSPTSPASASTSSPSASTCARRRTTCRSPAGSSRPSSTRWKRVGEALGIGHVEASPLTRSQLPRPPGRRRRVRLRVG